MTTTLTQSPGAVEPTSMDDFEATARAFAKRRARRLGILLGTATSIAYCVWSAWSWSRSSRELAGIDKIVVASRTFTVSLREKGELQAARSADIKCEVEGRSTIISLIDEGTAVKAGDLLVELASDEIEDRIRQEELKESNAITAYESAKTDLDIQRDKNASDIRKGLLQIELKRLELEKYELGDWGQTLKDASIAILEATITRERRKEDFVAAGQLYQRQFITETKYKEDEFDYQKSVWNLEKAEKAKQVLEQYTHVAELRQRESDLEEATKELERTRKNATAEELKKARLLEGKKKELQLTQDQLAQLREQKLKCRIVAPTPGFVVYYSGGGGRHWMSSDNQIKEGASVHERQILMQLPDTSEMTVIVRVHEAKTDKLEVGQRVVVQVEGMPGKRFSGRVTKIAALADTQNRWLNPDLKEYETVITLDPSDEALKPGATAHVEIIVETVEDRLAVPVQAVYTKKGQRYVFRNTSSGAEPVPIRLGAIGTEWAAVAEGLSAGDEVLLAFSDEQTRMLPDGPSDASDGPSHGNPQGHRALGGAAGHRSSKMLPHGKRRVHAKDASHSTSAGIKAGAQAGHAKKRTHP